MARPAQLPLFAMKKRARMGRPRLHDPGIAHVRRPSVSERLPLHVTLKMERVVWNLRSRRSFRIVEKALFSISQFANVCHFSVQGDHIHLLVEATDKRRLSSAMRSLGVRIARGMNRLMGRRGRVVAHRYHARALRTPSEVRRARRYVLGNHEKHARKAGRAAFRVLVDPYSSAAQSELPVPRTWLLRVGWRRGSE
jgi:REP element-mobilizing transposase RayT